MVKIIIFITSLLLLFGLPLRESLPILIPFMALTFVVHRFILNNDHWARLIWSGGMLFCIFFVIWVNNWAWNHAVFGDFPLLYGDAGVYYALAMDILSGDDIMSLRQINYLGYPIFLAYATVVSMLPTLLGGLWINTVIGGITALFLRKIAICITDSEQTGRLSMLFYFLSAQAVSTNVYLLKDPLLNLALVAGLYCFILTCEKTSIIPLLLLLPLIFIISLLRVPMVPALLVCGVMLLVFNRKSVYNKAAYVIFLLLLMLVAIRIANAAFSSGLILHDYVGDEEIINKQVDYVGGWEQESASDSIVFSLIAGNQRWPIWRKILSAPLFTLIQMSTPINIWHFEANPKWIPENNMMIVWYVLILPLIFAAIFRWKKQESGYAKTLFSLGIIGYVVISCIFGGVIPRYAIFFQMLLLIFAADILRKAFVDRVVRHYVSLVFMSYFFIGFCLFGLYIIYKF